MKRLRRAGEAATGTYGFAVPARPDTAADEFSSVLSSASDLEGDEVRNHAGQTLGHIEEILFDVPAGRIAFAILACSSGERSGDRFCAVPWDAFIYDEDNACFVLGISRERFALAPCCDKRDWRRLAEPRRLEELHAYYGTAPC